MAQTTEQLAAARELATQYGLTAADFFQHKQSKAWLISRTGIEKIQYGAGIEVRFEAVRIEMEYAAVKATGTRATKPTAALPGGALRIETFGSASKANCQVSYFLEMAEKRALSRVVLKLSDFYQLGVYGEDEMPPAALTAQSMPDAGTSAAVAGSPAMGGEYEAALKELHDGSSIAAVWNRYPELHQHEPFKERLTAVKAERTGTANAPVA